MLAEIYKLSILALKERLPDVTADTSINVRSAHMSY